MGCLALSFPRLALFLVWLLGGNYIYRAYDSFLLPLLGFIFLPLTTLAFAYSHNSLTAGGQMSPLGWGVVLLALFVDIGLLGGGSKSARKWRRQRS
jgi:hypothetical protein